ncbi:uncharacterized protein LOC134717735 [Mytilus trossulus]|uniref:uncharacterized protein LOC134717735 n=1 Tax=Mytilus trossulus TaxID=6551 RepID=UPI0030076610
MDIHVLFVNPELVICDKEDYGTFVLWLFLMDSLKIQPEDQLSSEFTVDDIPTIDVDSDRKTLRTTFKTINSILRQGASHQKLECADRISASLFMFLNDLKLANIFEKNVIKTKVLDTLLYLMKYEDYNDLIFKNDETCHLNIGIARCMCNLSNNYAGLGEHIYSFITAIVATLHNLARLLPVSQFVSDSKTAEAMVPLFSCKKERLEILATLAAAEICDDSQIHMLVDAEGVISSILQYLNEATQTSDYCFEGAALLELLSGIDKLACADKIKKKILEAGALPLFEAILNLDKPEEQALTARVLWTMTFDDDVATAVKSTKTLLARLQMLSKSSDKAVQNNEKGIQIWIDKEKMRGSTLEAIGHAVENAALVLICMSESYKRSPNCRLEAENTFRCGKQYIPLIVQKHYKPDSWLGVLLGAKLYIDFSGKYKFELKWNELIKELQAFKMLTEGEDTFDSSEVAMPDSTSSSTNPKTFTIDDVKQWLISNKLENCCQHFGDVNGKGLLQMKRMQLAAPEFYFKTLSRKLKLSLGEILNFSAALEEL